MKNILSIFVVVYTTFVSVWAQVITTDPAFPTESGALTITFYANRGTGGLAGYTGDVYAHTGVITNLSTSNSDWKYVKTNWGVNSTDTKLTRIATDTYTLTIPNPRTYYNVPAAEQIKKMAMVFRSGVPTSGTSYLEGKDTGFKDIFVEIYAPNALAVRIDSPVPSSDPFYPTFYNNGQSVDVAVVANGSPTSIDYIMGGQSIANCTAAPCTKPITFSTPGANRLIVSASISGASAYDTLDVYVNPALNNVPVPVGIKPGINYGANNSVTFVLVAPQKEFVYLLGDFNNWTVDSNYFMNRDDSDPNQRKFWITLNGLTAGQEYGFQYLVDGKIRVADPFSTKILDRWDDPYISASTYPNLKAYPIGKTEYAVGVVQPSAPGYTWNSGGYVRPDQRKLVIYELLLRDFVTNKNYKTLKDSLNYLKNLGVNAIQLMPIQEFDGNLSWGYNPAFHMALDKYYGTPNDFKAFIDAAHANGIAVIVDVVFNHATGQSPLIRMYNQSWKGDPGATPTSNSPYANTTARHPFNVFNDLNHDSALTKAWMDQVLAYWMTEYRVDGFRFDLSKGFTQTNSGSDVGLWGNYDASRIANLKRMADALWNVDNRAVIILEHFATNSEEKELAEYGTASGKPGMMLWGNMNHNFNEASMGWTAGSGSDLSGTYHGSRGWGVANLVGYMESHDEERLMYKNLQFGNANLARLQPYNIKTVNTALDRQKAVGAFLFLMPGPKMLWQFGELGYDYSLNRCTNGTISTDCRTAEKPTAFGIYGADLAPGSQSNRLKLYRTWSAFLKARHAYPVFNDPATSVSLTTSGAVKTMRLTHSNGQKAVIYGNFDVNTYSFPLNLDSGTAGTRYEYISGGLLNEGQTIRLEPGEVVIYTNFQITPAFTYANFMVDVDAEGNEIVKENALHAAFPNPFTQKTVLPFALSDAQTVRLELYDGLGRLVKTVVADEWREAGTHLAEIEAETLGSGLYFAKLKVGNQVFTQKLTIVR